MVREDMIYLERRAELGEDIFDKYFDGRGWILSYLTREEVEKVIELEKRIDEIRTKLADLADVSILKEYFTVRTKLDEILRRASQRREHGAIVVWR